MELQLYINFCKYPTNVLMNILPWKILNKCKCHALYLIWTLNTCFRAEEDAEIARRLEQDLLGEDVAMKRQRELHDEVTINLILSLHAQWSFGMYRWHWEQQTMLDKMWR